ncbi:hypothetical protein Bhyg_00051 [Pseudolycoriella hygida]|uniref:Uncharacterized protein n=1 Tax=Pseudolycoriella hygida TaxID=35572 RepID=A0A9Q0N846_9DIPT|nr:hypothetical protein Bhyg_00051 [Pseudolycoriella hygida]
MANLEYQMAKNSGILVSPGGKGLKALEAKMTQEGIVFTESQLQVLEKRRNEKEAHGEIETHHLGYLGCLYLGIKQH